MLAPPFLLYGISPREFLALSFYLNINKVSSLAGAATVHKYIFFMYSHGQRYPFKVSGVSLSLDDRRTSWERFSFISLSAFIYLHYYYYYIYMHYFSNLRSDLFLIILVASCDIIYNHTDK